MLKAFPGRRLHFILAFCLAATALLGTLTLLPAPSATYAAEETAGLLQPGDIAASGFSGVKLQVEGLPPGVDPLSKTVIDPEGVTLHLYGNSPFTGPLGGQRLVPPLRKEFKAKDIGHVFALAFDALPADDRGTPGLYAAATSAFGLYIVGPDKDGDGQPDRLMKGAPGAEFMDGLFGQAAPSGGAGAIWKIDSVTGEASLYAELSRQGVNNSGPAIGGLAFDPTSRSLYVADLDTGLIHQFKGAATGTDLAQYDHGLQGRPLAGKDGVADDAKRLDINSPDFDTANPATWAFTQIERRIDGMAVRGKRLYYAVAEGPEVWSVGLADDGSFLQDARIEAGVTISQPGTVTAIAFGNDGGMVLGIRNAVQNTADYSALAGGGPADVIRYAPESPDDPQTASPWRLDTLTYPVGQSDERRDGSGGVALQYAYKPDGGLDLAACGGTLIASGDVLGPQKTVHGLQIGQASQFQTAAGADIPTAFVSLDPAQDDAAARGHAGGVAVFSQCEGGGGFPAVASDETSFPGVAGGGGDQAGFPGIENGGGGQTGLPGIENGGGGQTDFPGVEGGGGQTGLPDVEGGGGQTDFPDVEGGGGKTNNLTLVKTGAVAKCSPKGGCAFNIEVRNNGPEVRGPITVNELIEAPQASLTGEPNDPWQCSKAAPFTCTHPGPVPANGKLTMRVVFAPNTAPDVKELKNCAALAGAAPPPGDQPQADNQQAGQPGASSCTTISLDPNVPVQAGPIVTSKKGPASCPIVGPCTFQITLTNTTDAAVPGPISFTDALEFPGAKLDEAPLPAPFSCSKRGPPFECTFGDAGQGLGPRESRTVSLTFNLDLPDGTTSLKNCAVKPSIPKKKAELEAPMNWRPQVIAASFQADPFANRNNLLHLTEGIGDVIGGVAEGAGGVLDGAVAIVQACTKFEMKNKGFVIKQSDGLVIRFGQMQVDPNGQAVGQANFFPHGGGGAISGTVKGTVSATSFVLAITWSNGSIGHYEGTIGADGRVTGKHSNAGVVRNTFVNDGNWWICKSSTFCEDYANKAVQAAKALAGEGCKPTGPAPRWSTDTQAQIDFCMARLTTPAQIDAENKARLDGHAVCKARKDACASAMPEIMKSVEELKAIGCNFSKDTPSKDIEQLSLAVCIGEQPPKDTSAFIKAFRDTVAGCKESIAKDAAERAKKNAKMQAEAAPEQCAVVDIKDITPPGGGGQVNQEPKPEQAQQPQASKSGALTLVKGFNKGSCVGNRCIFTIKVSNDSDTAVTQQPFEFTDEVTGDGALLASTTITADGSPKFDCSKQGQGFVCSNPNVTVPPKGSIDLTVTADLGKGVGAVKEMKNCATLKGAATPSCVTAPLQPPASAAAQVPQPSVKGDLTVLKRFSKTPCVGNSCVFNITITSSTKSPISSPLQFTEEVTGDGKSFAGATVTVAEIPAAKFTCSPQPTGFNCSTNKAEIPPMGTLSLTVTADLGKDAGPIKEMRNCAGMRGAASLSCDTAQLQPPQGANLMLEVLAPGAGANGIGTCSIDSACKFAVKTTSNGTKDVGASATFDAKVENGTVQSITAAPGGQGLACGQKGNDNQTVSCESGVKLPPQSFLHAEIPVIAGTTWKKNDTLTLCARLEPGDSNPKDDIACASVKLDPFSVKVTKTGDQSCTLGGDCNFAIKLFNPGPIDHNAPVTISDKLTGLSSAQIVSITPPLPCATQPTQIPFSCTSPGPVRLDLDAPEGSEFGPRDFKMVVRLPGDASATQFSNCADVSGGTGTPGTQSCVTVAATPPAPACQNGMVLANGICSCPTGTRWNGKSCVGDGTGGASMTKPIAPDVAPVISAEPVSCKFGMILASNGLCQCPANTKWNGKACEAGKGGGGFDMIKQAPEQAKSCPAGRPVGTYPNCCPQGTEYRNGNCRYQRVVPDQAKQQGKVCPADRPVGAYPNCCPRGTQYSNGKCRYTKPAQVKCPRSQKLDPATNTCIDRAPAAQRTCPADRPIGAYPNCCPRGYQFARGTCRRFREQRQQQQYCPADRPVGVYPNCCPDGYQFARGRCRPVRQQQQQQQYCPPDRPVGVYPNCCPDGYRFGRGRCRPVREQQQEQQQQRCPDGYEFRGRRCRPIRDQQQQQQPDQSNRPARKTCPDGSVVYGKYSQCPNDKPAPRPQPQQQRCTGGKVSTPNGCVCPNGTRESSGQCIDSVR